MKKYIHVIICSFLLIGFLLDSSLGYTQQCTPQQQFVFNNPSFEGPRQPHITPAPWNTCGLSPDTQPGSWGVNLAPSNGNSYIGLVQGGATWREGVSQQLSGNLQAGVTYTFTIDLAMGNSAQGGIVPAPTRIQIFGGNAACQMTQLLWTSPTVANTGWLTYTVTFTPNQNFGFIYIIIDNTAPMNSYMLIDNITPIVPQLPTIDITSHINGDVTACSFTLSGTLSMPLADSVILTGPFIGSPLHANVTGTTWSRNLQFNGPGTYTLYARVYYRDPVLNIDACSFDSVIVNVSAPSAAFSVPNHCLNGSVSLTDNSTGVGTTAIVGWNWTFGDGGSSSSQNPSHLYSSAGTYTVSLTITDAFGCVATISDQVTVYPLPTASFTANNACQNSAVSFSSTSAPGVGTVSQTLWDVDNNGTTDYTSNSASHIYPQDGNHIVTLIVETNNGCRDTVQQNVTVYSLPIASFTSSPACQNQAVSFNSTSTVNNSTVTQTRWDVDNNGTTDYTSNPANHVYPQDGNHTVTLIVESAQGCRDTISQAVTVYPLPVASFTFVNACDNEAVTFNSTSTVSSGTISQTLWDVDNNGTTDYTSNPASHIYPQDGNHTIRLIVESNNGCRDTISQVITVYPLPAASFTFANACDNEAVTFNSTSTVSSGTVAQTLWDVESDGTTDYTTVAGNHIYPQDGSHAITLIVETNNGCRDTIRQMIEVYPLPIASFTANNACLNDVTNFQSTSTVTSGTITQTFWDVQNNNTVDYVGTSGSHTYPQDGTYSIQLITITNNGCGDTVVQNVIVYPLPVANFTTVNVCHQENVPFISSSSVSSGTIQQTLWDMESNGTTEYSSASGNHMYPNAGTYLITLIVVSDMGCRDTISRNVQVYPLPIADFSVDKTVLTLDERVVTLNNTSTGEANWEWDLLGQLIVNESSIFYEFLDTGEFCFTLRVISDRGCEDVTERCVTVQPGFNFYIPNSFTPNEDKINQVFIPKGLGFVNFRMEIFTRWGDKIFETFDLKNGWTGIDNQGKDYPQGVYVYKIQVIDYKNQTHDYVGNVNLLR